MIMMGLYTIILAFSAYLASYLGGRTLVRLARNAGMPAVYAQLVIPLAAIAFLMVVSMSTGVLLAALLLAMTGLVAKPQASIVAGSVLWPFLAAILLATVGVWESPGNWPSSVPPIGFLVLAAMIFTASLFATRTAELTLPMLSGVALAACVPLMVSPLVFTSAHSSMALDASIILASLLGALIVLPATVVAASFVRLPLAVLLAYGAIQAMHYGAWPLGIVSLLVWLAGVKLAPRAMAEGL